MKMGMKLALCLSAALALTACGDKKEEHGTLTHRLKLVGEDGKYYGRAELDPVGGGRLYDAQNNQIGVITTTTGGAPAAPAYTAPTGY